MKWMYVSLINYFGELFESRCVFIKAKDYKEFNEKCSVRTWSYDLNPSA